ncbi:unnamed protein product [Urochloa humidicola]
MAGSPPSPPPPFPSHPSDAELIESYLRPRVVSGAKVGEFIHEVDWLYAAAPDDLTGPLRPATAGDGEKAWYFFTTVQYKSEFKVRIRRAVDAGERCWESEEESPQPVLSDLGGQQIQIGLRQAFAFVRKEGARAVRSGWIMVELRLDPKELRVMCKVYRSLSDPKAIDVDAAASGPRLEIREAGNKDPVAERAAAAAERQKKVVLGEGAGTARTSRAIDASEKGKEPAEEPEEVEAPGVHAMAAFPAEAELINSYLRPWAESNENAAEFIHEADVYAEGPVDLAGRFTPVLARDRGEEAWYFLTKQPRGCKDFVTRRVDSGEGRWCYRNTHRLVDFDDGSAPRNIGQSQTLTFTRKVGKRQVHMGWLMVELRLDSSNPNALYKLYRSPRGKEADDEASAVGRDEEDEEDGEEIDSAAAGPGLKRKAGDEGSGAAAAAAAGAPGSKEADDEASSAVGREEGEEDSEEIDSAAGGPGLKRKAGDKKGSGAETAAASIARTPEDGRRREPWRGHDRGSRGPSRTGGAHRSEAPAEAPNRNPSDLLRVLTIPSPVHSCMGSVTFAVSTQY